MWWYVLVYAIGNILKLVEGYKKIKIWVSLRSRCATYSYRHFLKVTVALVSVCASVRMTVKSKLQTYKNQRLQLKKKHVKLSNSKSEQIDLSKGKLLIINHLYFSVFIECTQPLLLCAGQIVSVYSPLLSPNLPCKPVSTYS